MRSTRNITILFGLLALIASACGGEPETLASTEGAEQVSEDATAIASVETTEAPPLGEIDWVEDPELEESVNDDPVTTTEPEATTTTEVEAPTCEAPVNEYRFVDVAIDDADGGLNMRTDAGASFEIIATLPRGVEVTTTGECAPVGTTEWWVVIPTGAEGGGWVSSKYLSPHTVFNPGLGAMIEDVDNVDLIAEDLDQLAARLAVNYGFDEDVVITEVEIEALDAIGGDATYEFTGLKDDSVNGYRVEISWWVDRSADGNEVYGVIAKRIGKQAMCTRGVTNDGLCI